MRTPVLALAVAAMAMTGLVGNAAGLSSSPAKPRKDPEPRGPRDLDAMTEAERARERRLNERRWEEMTQSDIDRLTAAHEKRKRKGKR